jgi:kumamolisin
VGGTDLVTDANLNYVSEFVWNYDIPNGTNEPPTGYVGSTGGVTQYAIPSWQVPIIGGIYTNRTIPDVALTADDVFIYDNDGNKGGEAGTSCASPLWAGFMALVNAQAAAAGQSNAGFLNPTLYADDTTHGDPDYTYSQLFHDVPTGSNCWLLMPTNFFATTNYDLCTGLGTPTSNLLSSISGTDHTIWVHQSGPSTNSGSFAYPLGTLSAGVTAVPSSGTIVLLNGSASPGAVLLTKAMKLVAVGGTSTIGP